MESRASFHPLIKYARSGYYLWSEASLGANYGGHWEKLSGGNTRAYGLRYYGYGTAGSALLPGFGSNERGYGWVFRGAIPSIPFSICEIRHVFQSERGSSRNEFGIENLVKQCFRSGDKSALLFSRRIYWLVSL